MVNAETFRPKSGYVWFALTVLLCLGLVAEALFRRDYANALGSALFGTGLAIGGWLLFVRPKVVVGDHGITITNALSETTVGWHAVEEIETRYCMSITVEGKKIYAVAAPAPGRYHARTIHPTEVKGLHFDDPEHLRAGDSPRTHSGVAAQLARRRWRAYNREGQIETIESSTRRTTGLAAAAGVLVALSLLLQLLHL